MQKHYHLGDVLSITTGRLVSSRHIDGVYDILGFMTGEDLFTHALPRAADVCRPHLLRQYPHLSKEALESDLKELDRMLAGNGSDRAQATVVVAKWLADMTAKHGEMLEVETLPKDAYHAMHPVDEAVAMGVDPLKIVLAPAVHPIDVEMD